MAIQLSEHFTYSKLIRFTIPSIIMMFFTSIYNIVDGLFVSNFVGATEFAAINLVFPFIMILGAIGFMFSSGGSALVAKTLGEKNKFKANQIFSLLVYSCIVIGIILAIIGLTGVKKALILYGVDGKLLNDAILYCKILMPATPIFMLQFLFQAFFITAEKPTTGMIVTVLAGLTNIVLDAVFIIILKWGIAGAALATIISQSVGRIMPLIYFALPKKTPLRLGKTKFYPKALIKACTNGASEFMTQISMSIVAMLYNYQLLKLAGENGVIAFGVISYINFIFLSVFIGFSIGSNPIVSYHYGAKNTSELKNLFKKNFIFIAVSAIILMISAELSAKILSAIFVGYDEYLLNMTTNAFRIYAISFLLAGFNIYASAFFTALNNGLISAIISFFRTLVCECSCVMLLPIFFGITGIWSSIIVAEAMALILSIYLVLKFKTKYQYI